MNIILFLAGIHIPSFMKKRRLLALFELTARAFQTRMPELGRASFALYLEEYALFTNAAAERVLKNAEGPGAVKARLYENAFAFGRQIGRVLRVDSFPEVMKAARLLYRQIGIDFQGNASGEIVIKKCYFSRVYSPQVCGLVSSLDEGILAGLAAGGKLTFDRRITAGGDCCRALFRIEGRPS